jgi:uncharacterized OsmC-like protein
MQAKVTTRNHGFVVGQPASFDVEDVAPAAVEYLLAAVAGALTTGLQWRLSRQQVAVHNLEVVAKARSHDPMQFLGLADGGSPALAAIEVTVYVDADTTTELLEATVHDTVRRCPVTQSLLHAVPVATQLRTL